MSCPLYLRLLSEEEPCYQARLKSKLLLTSKLNSSVSSCSPLQEVATHDFFQIAAFSCGWLYMATSHDLL